MGLIKAALGSVGGVLADQWKEYFYCDAMDNNTLVIKGEKKSSRRSSNKRGDENIISNGSGIAVADGQCMVIVEQGKIVDFSAEPGTYTYDKSSEPSIFAGKFGESLIQTFKTIGRRFTYGGDTGNDQRVYYINTKEILDNKFGTPTPIMFRVVDSRLNLDVDVSLRCNGMYSFHIADPVLFYTKLCGNIAEVYTKDLLMSQMKGEFISALGPAVAKLSSLELRPNQIPLHSKELEENLNAELSGDWKNGRGIEIVTVAMNPPTLTEEDMQLIQTAQQAAIYANPMMAAGALSGAQAQAMKDAAKNPNGAVGGFMGMGMAMNSVNTQNLYAMGMQQQQQQQMQQQQQQQAPAAKDTWKCSCGSENTGKFCPVCGKKKPEAEGWVCSCGAVNKGKFCTECGKKKPAGVPQYKCDKCGWEPKKGEKPPKFCPECGDPFDDGDLV